MTPAEAAAAARWRRLARRAKLEEVGPALREAELALVRVVLAKSWGELDEALDLHGKIVPLGHAPGLSPDVAREWPESEQRRLLKVWDRTMKGTDAVGILAAL